jgi:hypothetical protein
MSAVKPGDSIIKNAPKSQAFGGISFIVLFFGKIRLII